MKKRSLPPKPENRKPPPAKTKREDSDDIERAVYDGMQDLRAEKPMRAGKPKKDPPGR